MYRATTARRFVYLWAFFAVLGFISAIVINLTGETPVEIPQTKLAPKSLFTCNFEQLFSDHLFI